VRTLHICLSTARLTTVPNDARTAARWRPARASSENNELTNNVIHANA